MDDCVFCKISKKEIAAEIVFEDNQVLAFKDIRPSAPVHYLVIPRDHIQSIAHLSSVRGHEGSQRDSAPNGVEGNHPEIVARLIYVAKDLAKKLGLTGYKLVFNVGREGGQLIDHLHLHLLGGWTKKEDIESMPHPRLDK